MKLILFAAAAAFAVPAMAQTTGDTMQTPTSGTMQTQSTTGTMATHSMSTRAMHRRMMRRRMARQNMNASTNGSMANGDMSTAGTDNGSGTPLGGYQPSTPPMSGQPTPGAPVNFQPSQSPDQAYPPPPAQASYPPCKPGQTDGCTERENARGQGIHRH